MRLTLLLVALFGLCVCLSFAEESVVEDDHSELLDARHAIRGKGKGRPKPAAGGSKSTKVTSKPTSKATVVSNKASKSASQVTTKNTAASVTGSKTTSLVATTSSSSTVRSSSISSSNSVASTPSSPSSSSLSLAVSTSTASTSNAASTSSDSTPASGNFSPTSSIPSASTTDPQYCAPTISKKNLLKTTICICPDGIRASASKTPNPPCPYTTVPPLSAMLPMQDTDENSGESVWGKAWEVAKPHAGHVAGKAGQFAVDRYGQPIKDKFDHLIPVKSQDVSAADLAQVDPDQVEQAEESEAAEVEHSTHENGRSGIDDEQAGVVQDGASVDGGAGNVGHGDGVDETATQGSSQDVGQTGQENGSPSKNLGHNDQMANANQQMDGASQQSGATLDNMEGESPKDISGQGNRGNAAANRDGIKGNQGKQTTAAQSSGAQSDATRQGITQDAGSDEINNDPDPAPHNQPQSHIRPRRVASSLAVSPSLNWNGTSSSGGGVSPSDSVPSVPLGNSTTSGANGNDNPACPVHGDVSPDEMQGDDNPDSALSIGIQSECKQKRHILRLRTVSNCSKTVISSGSTFTSTMVCNEDVVTARDEICDPSRSTAATGGSFATGSAASSGVGSAFFPNGTVASDPIMKTANAGSTANLGARNPRPRDGGPFVVDKSYAGSGSNSSVRSRMAGTAYSGIGIHTALPAINIDGQACSARLSSNITVSNSSKLVGNNSSIASVTGINSSSVAPLRKEPIGPISARDGPGSGRQSHIRLLASHSTSSALSQDSGGAETRSRPVHLGSAVLGQRWAHEFTDVPSTTQAAGAEETGSVGSKQLATDVEDTGEDHPGITETAFGEEYFDQEQPFELTNIRYGNSTHLLQASSSRSVEIHQHNKRRNSSAEMDAILKSNATAPSSPKVSTSVSAATNGITSDQTSELYNPRLTSNAPVTSPAAILPLSTSSIQVSTVTVTADPWVWTTTLGQNGDEQTNGTVIACEVTTGINVPITDAPRCVTTGDARWAILSTPPPTPYVYVKAPVDSSAYVGNLTATALSSALYSALSVACPDEECQPNATIPGIVYPGSHGDMKEGELAVTIHDGHLYTKDEGIRNLTFTLAAILANASSTEMCFDYSKAIGTRDPSPAPLVPPPPMVHPVKTEEVLLCNMAGLMLIEYYSGNRTDGPDTRLFLSFSFQNHEGGSDMTAEICEKVMLGMDIAGTLLACIPIIGPIINAVMKASKAACRMAEKVEETANKIDAAISAGTEVVDNLLSLKSDLPLSLPAS
ncbi:hypothetical protein KC332_g8631 [Hortaea werneckii]|nr:hypothetical protein KC350_g13019 [Hortaea werneckii]KAI6817821.1 hypothetical protein KC358_g10167 [Hortaea werneckii]KAI6909833.1 hypothetical protein KC348_g13391 [Hortaea werneckii]KAI6939083.1 hypothetical protein KC341_g4425 [Hortaea werneckii]KAI6965196.1 hypothetical protein KC321_g10234 [Hortaea werneckii]